MSDRSWTVFRVGLTGGIATGKSTVARQLEPHYGQGGDDKMAFVYVDVWRFQLDSFRRQFLLDVEEKLDSQGVGSGGKVRKQLKDPREVPRLLQNARQTAQGPPDDG